MIRGMPTLQRFRVFRVVLSVLLPFLAGAYTASHPGWRHVGGPLYNVSGMAYVGVDPGRGGEQFLVVHDNKKPGEPHAGIVTLRTGKARYTRLRWPDRAGMPVDLEAISPLPDAPGRFLALESGGRLFHLRYAGGGLLEVLTIPATIHLTAQCHVIARIAAKPVKWVHKSAK